MSFLHHCGLCVGSSTYPPHTLLHQCQNTEPLELQQRPPQRSADSWNVVRFVKSNEKPLVDEPWMNPRLCPQTVANMAERLLKRPVHIYYAGYGRPCACSNNQMNTVGHPQICQFFHLVIHTNSDFGG
jgi:hypothetical protein